MKLVAAPANVRLHIIAVLAICPVLLAHISAMEETVAEGQHPSRVLIDGNEEQNVLHRERRQVKNNSGPSLADIEKRLQVLEAK